MPSPPPNRDSTEDEAPMTVSASTTRTSGGSGNTGPSLVETWRVKVAVATRVTQMSPSQRGPRSSLPSSHSLSSVPDDEGGTDSSVPGTVVVTPVTGSSASSTWADTVVPELGPSLVRPRAPSIASNASSTRSSSCLTELGPTLPILAAPYNTPQPSEAATTIANNQLLLDAVESRHSSWEDISNDTLLTETQAEAWRQVQAWPQMGDEEYIKKMYFEGLRNCAYSCVRASRPEVEGSMSTLPDPPTDLAAAQRQVADHKDFISSFDRRSFDPLSPGDDKKSSMRRITWELVVPQMMSTADEWLKWLERVQSRGPIALEAVRREHAKYLLAAAETVERVCLWGDEW